MNGNILSVEETPVALNTAIFDILPFLIKHLRTRINKFASKIPGRMTNLEEKVSDVVLVSFTNKGVEECLQIIRTQYQSLVQGTRPT